MEDDSIYDLIVVGSGAAGLTAALEAGDKKVLVVTKTDSFSSGSTPLAQGGIAASVGSDDSPSLHYKDTVEAGVYSGLSEQISFLTKHGASAIGSLLNMKMAFDKNDSGNLDRNREGAHSRRRVLKAGGDATGRVLVKTLYKEAVKRPNIKWLSNTFIYDLLILDNQIHGVVAYTDSIGWKTIYSPRVLLATGGLGQLFGHTTNPVEATGDSMAIAIRSGLKLKDIEMVQFHPTALDIPGGDSLKLLTEALRGDGAVLVKEDGTPFMGKYSPMKDLAPRDVVSRGIWYEMMDGNKVYLDLKPIHDIKTKFPTVTSFCLKAGLNPKRDLIPVTPAVHYVMGGIDINSKLPDGLGVAGEAAYTGVHGANRLASNSLLECLVYGKSEVNRIMSQSHGVDTTLLNHPDLITVPPTEIIDLYKKELQNIMYKYCGIIRSKTSLVKGQEMLENLEQRIYKSKKSCQPQPEYRHFISWLEVNNMILLGKSLLKSALNRKESRGAHYREDYPDKSTRWDRIKLPGETT